jgi:hypothetical protein
MLRIAEPRGMKERRGIGDSTNLRFHGFGRQCKFCGFCGTPNQKNKIVSPAIRN